VAISVRPTDVFLYTGSAKAADEAGQVARAVLEEQGRRITEIQVECWDPAGGQWRDPGEPAEYEDELRPGRLRTTAAAIVKAAGEAWQWADFP
jgi:hypothetical protein